LKPRFNDLHQQLPQLIEYTTLMEKLTDNQKFISSFQHEYKAEATAIEDIKALRSWYKRVRDTFGVGFGPKVALANQLFALADDVFKGAAHLAKHQALADLDSVNSMMNQLVDVLDLEGLSNASVDLVGPQGSVTKAASKLQANLRDVQPAVKADLLLSETKLYAAQLGLWLDRMKAFETNTIEVELFEQRYLIDLDQWDSGVCQSHLDTLALYHAIQALQCDSLKHFLTKHINAGILAEIATDMANIEQLFKSQEKAKDTFSQCVDLDVEAWFKQAEKALEGWIKRNDTALENPKWLVSWVDFIRNRSKLAEQGLENLLHKIELGDIALEDIEGIYQYSVFDMLSREIITEEQSLAHFSGADHNAIRKQFQHYDNKLKALQREKVAHAVAQGGIEHVLSGVASGRVADYTEMGLIQNEVNKKTRHVPIRQLIKRAGKSVAALKPCFLMGPNSVAQYLAPGEIEFDLVIMDEASQIKPQDALGTIARGKQVVVVGDPKQLPPTSFFDKNVDSDDEEAMAIEQSESILDVSLPMFSARRLRWHYRSRHESLIAFSNKEFYDSNLVVFPSPSSQSDEFGVKFSYIKRGRFVNSRNIEEAQIIARSARKHLLNHAGESLGIVAMNSQQREQIERCIEELAKEDALFAEALSRNQASEEPLFIKNLENVQGDERDVIYISFTYGPQEAGANAMPQRFGPINNAAGGRRLNVLFTRSKKRMHIFSSMKEGHIRATDKSSVGVHALKRFLGYAESGRLEQAQITGRGPDSNFEVSVMEALQREGFTCEPQIGVAGYFIDLAVRDPNQPGRFLMGIECDGATYHSAKSARDRDRLRQSVLEGLGWKIHRIWSTDWFKNPQAQLVPIIEQLRLLSSAKVGADPGSASEVSEILEEIALDDQQHLSIDDISAQPLTLEQKLNAFAERIDKLVAAVSQNQHVLRPAMIAALVKHQPVNKNEFVEFLPSYLVQGTAAEHRLYLPQIFNIIAEHEEEKEASLERVTTELDE
jgi:very-short-patch-repair endonuclease